MTSRSGLHLRSRLQLRLLRPRLSAIRLVVCDVDGVLTDGGLHYNQSGDVVKRFDVRDGLAVRMLQRAGITVSFLSGGCGGAIEQRARHLDIHHCLIGIADKYTALDQLQRQLELSVQETAYIGDDLNDLPVRPITGMLITPSDAVRGLRRKADWVLTRKGGDGALREVCDVLLDCKGRRDELFRLGWFDINA